MVLPNDMKEKTTILILLFLMMLSLPSSHNPAMASNMTEARHSTPKISAYVEHNPIVINSDSDLKTQGWPGNGTVENPFTIADLCICLTAEFSTAIILGNTTKCVNVSNCKLNSSLPGDAESNAQTTGITLYNVSNCIIHGNVFNSIEFPICDGDSLSPFSNITIDNNGISNSAQSIRFDCVVGYNIRIEDNFITETSVGIFATGLDSSAIAYNHITNGSTIVVLLDSPTNTKLMNNTIIGYNPLIIEGGINNTIFGNYLESSFGQLILEIDESNNNTILWNKFIDSPLQDGWGTIINDSGNHSVFCYNYYNDYDGYDLNGDGFGDIPYHIEYGNANSTDPYPIGKFSTEIVRSFGTCEWLNDTVLSLMADIRIPCEYYLYSPCRLHFDIPLNYSSISGALNSGWNTIFWHMSKGNGQFWGCSVLFNNTISSQWYDYLAGGMFSGDQYYSDFPTYIRMEQNISQRCFWEYWQDGMLNASGVFNEPTHTLWEMPKNMSLGNHTFTLYFRRTVNGSRWVVYDGWYYVEHDAPVISNPTDVACSLEEAMQHNRYINWTVYDMFLYNYTILVDGIPSGQHGYFAQTFYPNERNRTESVGMLVPDQLGNHSVTLVVEDLYGNIATDTVLISIFEDTNTVATSTTSTSIAANTTSRDFTLISGNPNDIVSEISSIIVVSLMCVAVVYIVVKRKS